MRDRTFCRLLIDPPASGAWNMAVDETILESASRGEGCWWRFYQWEEPTLSLGHFQSVDDRDRHAASRHCPVVRRASGGGAIVHDRELTYSFIAAADHPFAQQRSTLYRTIHATLIEALASLGVQAAIWNGEHPSSSSPKEKPFLCFQRRAVGDVVVDNDKIAGSAQRRRRNAVLQHGSVLLHRSVAAPELPGIADLVGKTMEAADLIEPWLGMLADRLGLAFSEHSLSAEQRDFARRSAETTFASSVGTRARPT